MAPKSGHGDESAAVLARETGTGTSTATNGNASSPLKRGDNGDNDNDFYYYLTEDAREKLKTYSYRGTDHSLLYHYLLSPLAAFLVDAIVPRSMAPNTVTTIGLAWMVGSYAVCWWYAPDLEPVGGGSDDDDALQQQQQYPPRWIFLWNGISLLVYQTLDNMDGKQARKTGSSSPLGLFFDHGCDAINSIFGSANMIIAMNLSPRENAFETWLLVFGPFVMFYIATWEQYFTGELVMPIFNGPNEGLVVMSLISFVSYWLGSACWLRTDVFEKVSSIGVFRTEDDTPKLRHCDLIVVAGLIMASQEVILKTLAVTPKYKKSAAGLVPMAVLALCFLVVGWVDPNTWLDIPRTSLHLSMVLFVEMSTELMLAHVTAQEFVPWRWQLAPLAGITLWVSALGNGPGPRLGIVVYTWAMGAYLVAKIGVVVREICSVLEIWCFDIVTPHRRGKK
mmetsp:Transcript_97567/g.198152  ORF Transcript_97567/g.198152 Transcript_97567/m.198152 type:complete len:450 (+) Transcript_97567:134-1483(+)